MGIIGHLIPKYRAAGRDPKMAPPWAETPHTTYRHIDCKVSPPVFGQLALLSNPKILYFTVLSYRPETLKSGKECPFLWGIYTPSNT